MSVELLDTMGTDLDIANSARVSMGKESDWDFTCTGYTLEPSFAPGDDQYRPVYQKCLQDKDRRLINFLARNAHWTPFSQNALKFRFRMPVFIARQWFRSNVGIVRNEISRRYVSEDPEFFVPNWRSRPGESIKQGSGEELDADERLYWDFKAKSIFEEAKETYTQMIEEGVAPEQARAILPQAMYTEFIETGNVASYARIVNLRDDPHAQVEIQEYARLISDKIRDHFPVSWSALVDHENK